MSTLIASYIFTVQRYAILAPVFIVMEILAPRERVSWASRGRSLVVALIQIFAATASITGVAMLNIRPLFVVPGPVTIPFALIYILITDLPFYWMHRLAHKVPLLWRLHSVHHSVREMHVLVAQQGHFLEEGVRALFQFIPLALLVKVGPAEAPWIFLGPPLLDLFAHANTRLHLGPLKFLLLDNRMHRIHHSIEPRHYDKNFAGISPIWDILFGTAYFPAADEWPATGVVDQNPTSVVDYLTAPFRRRPALQRAPEASQSLSSA